MQGYITLKDGWVSEIHTCEMGINYDAHVAAGDIPIANQDVIRKIILCQPIMFWDGKQFCQVKDPKTIWKRIRLNNLPGTAYKKLTDSLDASFSDVPTGTVIDTPPAIKKIFDPDFEVELKPGLKVSLSTEDDVELWEKSMVDSGLYTLQEAFSFAQYWLSDPLTWPVKVTWKDRPLQIELHRLSTGNTLIGGFTAHLDRTRPRWFWKQTALPVLKALYAHGFESINEQVRIDKPHYAEFLSETYGHEILRSTDKFINLRLNIKEGISRIGPWPTRRTMGADWKWEKDGILVREATEKDFPAIYQAIDTSWGDKPRKQLALDNFEAQWNLDSASVLLTFDGGKIIEARSVKERSDMTINIGVDILKSRADQRTAIADIGVNIWKKSVGYKESSYIIETKLYERIKDQWLQRGLKMYKQDENITECRSNIEEALAKKQTS